MDAAEYGEKELLRITNFVVKDKELGNVELNFKYYYGKCLEGGNDKA